MGPRVGVTFVIIAVLICSSVSYSAAKPAAASGDSGKVALTYDSGRKVTCLTPRWATGGNQIQIHGSSGKAAIAGKSVPVAGWKIGTGSKIGLDSDGDGIVNTDREYKKAPDGGSVVLTGKIDGKELSVRCSDIRVHYDANKGEVRSMRWRMQGVYGWVGQIGSENIRILDENLDGKYGNDGKDAIQIGRSRLALPLRRRHRIGEDFYSLKIAPDGSSLEFTKLKDVPVGLVRTPFAGKYLVGLVLDGAPGAFDIRACSRTGIPAGDYTVVYGVVGNPRSPVALYRGRSSNLKYNIQADKNNLLRIGPPLQLVFHASYKEEEKKNNSNKSKKPIKKPVKINKKQMIHKIGVRKPDRVIGSAGEEYGPVVFPNPRSPRGRPGVFVYQGSRIIGKGVMLERDGNIQDFWYELPRKFSPMSIRVMMVATVGGLGKVSGVRTLKQIYDKEAAGPPKTDKPAVSTTPWKKPVRSGRVAIKPKPPITAKPKPTPAPTTKPVVGTRPPKPKPSKPVSSSEQKADRLLKLARSYEKMKLNAKYVQMLKKTVEKYPDTRAAITAKELLTAME